MSLGAGIFLSALVLSALVLYLQTRDRWNWRKIFLRAIGSSIAIMALGAFGFWTYLTYEARPVVQTEYYDVPIAASKADVVYRIGTPGIVIGLSAPEDTSNPGPWDRFPSVLSVPKDLPAGKDVKDYDIWSYDNLETPGGRIDITFNAKTHVVQAIACYTHDLFCDDVSGVYIGWSEDAAVARLGKPKRTRMTSETSKAFDYPNLNISLHFSKQKIYMMEVRKFE